MRRVEVRPNDDGTIDEVLLYDGDECLFHLEQLDDGLWYFNLYPSPAPGFQGMAGFNISRDKRRVVVTQYE